MKNLKEIRDRMIEIVGQPDRLGFINARLVLRTGITLNDHTHAVTADEVGRVISALKDMGYAVDVKEGKV